MVTICSLMTIVVVHHWTARIHRHQCRVMHVTDDLGSTKMPRVHPVGHAESGVQWLFIQVSHFEKELSFFQVVKTEQ
ncbi:hypothetical protein MRB53_033628 [Persea americana]|uniref:Uncharacterized protein n=1 Tax=Persea americana TaxID=3435 RepID=A0ACC2KVG1_PERAE|nr:hypothetical protein MRB53_033628 [Persea americana]